mmetsp:Transcript_23865/g.74601  ORF Transcript_23865/g.74601 Transcript_23865/m.74601 type:complete len:445 (-) Transcript_23865:37-1371(-)
MCKATDGEPTGLPKTRELRDFTLEEVAKHNSRDSCWIIIHDHVYDVTTWLTSHPGGDYMLLNVAGKDASDAFDAYHQKRVRGMLKRHQIGSIQADCIKPLEPVTKDYRELRERLWAEGWFDPSLPFFYKTIGIIFSLLAVSTALFVAFRGNLMATVVASACLGMMMQQSLLVAHDALHSGIFRNKKYDYLVGRVMGTVGGGVCASWWLKDHNTHHVLCNELENDTTAGQPPFITMSELQVDNPKESWPLWWRVITKLQPILYMPICLLVARTSLQVRSAIENPNMPKDAPFLLAHIAWQAAFYKYIVPPEHRLLAFGIATFAVSVLHLQILLNHLSMPMFKPEDNERLGWFRYQTATTMNITAFNAVDNWYYGGLHFQLEHHLFPLMPRPNLRKLKPVVQALCKQHGVEYRTENFFDANVSLFKTLSRVGSYVKMFDVVAHASG